MSDENTPAVELSFSSEPQPEPSRTPSDWQQEIGVGQGLFRLVSDVVGWTPQTVLTREEFLAAVARLSFELH